MAEPRVCVVAPLYHPSLGGLGRQAHRLTESLAEAGVRTFVITRRLALPDHDRGSDRAGVVRIWTPWPERFFLEQVGFASVAIGLAFAFGSAWTLFRRRNEYDIVHFHGARAALYAAIPVLRLLDKRVIAKVSGIDQPLEAASLRGRWGPLGSLLARLVTRVDRFVAVSARIEQGLVRDGIDPRRIARIPNFIDLTDRGADDATSKSGRADGGRHRIVLFCGRLVPLKGVQTLLEAWKDVSRGHESARLLIVGDGPFRRELESLSGSLGISSTVSFLGWQKEVSGYYRGADLFVQPSFQEGMSNALLEAMSYGLPAVATRIAGNEDVIVHGENGMLVEPAAPAELAAAVDGLLRDRARAAELGTRAEATIREGYALERIRDRYLALYRALMEQR